MTVLRRKVEGMLGEAFLLAVTAVEVTEPCAEGTSMLGDTAFLVASIVPGRLVWEPWLLPDDAAAIAGVGFCCTAICLGANWLPE